ncbi:MAG: pyridoxamine 5'-phosphate oxidase family protein, partial [Alphaproteobacteria bacterium]|nr:pyridoxamine 5'-phosphate oxidase family protein [Alphaproteobacteria bacterium]
MVFKMDYESIVSEIERLFKDTKFATLATADKSGAPAIGQMCLISDGLTIYMQTYDRFEKVGNIRENPYVAIN